MGEAEQRLQASASDFASKAGPSRSWTEADQGTLASALDTGSTEDMDSARSLLAAQYGGPSGLDETEAAAVRHLLGNLNTEANAADTVAGSMDLLQRQNPNMTYGELLFEAKQMAEDPTYRNLSQEQVEAVRNLLGSLNTTEVAATDYATQRVDEEKAIRDAAKAYLTDRETQLTSDLDATVEAKRADQQAIEDLYASYMETGDTAVLQEIERRLGGLTSPEAAPDAPDILDGILNAERYASIRDVPELGELPVSVQRPWAARQSPGRPRG